MENQDASTTIYTDIWPKNAEDPRKKERRGRATNVTNKDTCYNSETLVLV